MMLNRTRYRAFTTPRLVALLLILEVMHVFPREDCVSARKKYLMEASNVALTTAFYLRGGGKQKNQVDTRRFSYPVKPCGARNDTIVASFKSKKNDDSSTSYLRSRNIRTEVKSRQWQIVIVTMLFFSSVVAITLSIIVILHTLRKDKNWRVTKKPRQAQKRSPVAMSSALSDDLSSSSFLGQSRILSEEVPSSNLSVYYDASNRQYKKLNKRVPKEQARRRRQRQAGNRRCKDSKKQPTITVAAPPAMSCSVSDLSSSLEQDESKSRLARLGQEPASVQSSNLSIYYDGSDRSKKNENWTESLHSTSTEQVASDGLLFDVEATINAVSDMLLECCTTESLLRSELGKARVLQPPYNPGFAISPENISPESTIVACLAACWLYRALSSSYCSTYQEDSMLCRLLTLSRTTSTMEGFSSSLCSSSSLVNNSDEDKEGRAQPRGSLDDGFSEAFAAFSAAINSFENDPAPSDEEPLNNDYKQSKSLVRLPDETTKDHPSDFQVCDASTLVDQVEEEDSLKSYLLAIQEAAVALRGSSKDDMTIFSSAMRETPWRDLAAKAPFLTSSMATDQTLRACASLLIASYLAYHRPSQTPSVLPCTSSQKEGTTEQMNSFAASSSTQTALSMKKEESGPHNLSCDPTSLEAARLTI